MEYIGYFCGGFSLAGGRDEAANALPAGWKEDQCSAGQREGYELYYLPDFVRFCLSHEPGEDMSMRRFSMTLDASVTVPAAPARTSGDLSVKIPELRLYLFPFRLALFAIHVEMEDAGENDITAITALLRNLRRLDEPELKAFHEAAVRPVLRLWEAISAASRSGVPADTVRLVEDGNKFNVFQIVSAEPADGDERDKLLFELATVAPAGSYDAKSLDSPSEAYFRKLLDENSLSVYNNWKCLALSDTLTILCSECPEWLISNWKNDYFGLIYIWQLFRRNYLFRLTRRFRYERENVASLERESVDFERNCSFHRISYNFLPEEFSACVARGLRIEKEKNELYHMIAQEESAGEKRADNRMNSLLFFMTCLTMASTIYDTCCLLQELLPYDTTIGSSVTGFRLVTSLMLTIVLAALLIYRTRVRKL